MLELMQPQVFREKVAASPGSLVDCTHSHQDQIPAQLSLRSISPPGNFIQQLKSRIDCLPIEADNETVPYQQPGHCSAEPTTFACAASRLLMIILFWSPTDHCFSSDPDSHGLTSPIMTGASSPRSILLLPLHRKDSLTLFWLVKKIVDSLQTSYSGNDPQVSKMGLLAICQIEALLVH